jgi:hypothetical protein
MTVRKWILLGLLFPAVGVGIAAAILLENVWLEYVSLIFSIPVMVLNYWEWSNPEAMDVFFKQKRETWGLWAR